MNKGKIIVAGIGPGSEADITPAVLAAIQSSDVIISLLPCSPLYAKQM